ncbi:alpha/beta fold hydrolase [Aequorivita lipolytica]|uniref:Alpha/beta hydrolase n=1 Tax=Aequorivita lipolytica TaxID=153267 RepID=A0A5C6YQG6_9FLAO|nr:alpha/beta hydrolase [Aequorivita lipolytica]TXD69651.1 alpha/beta hydrolase [Aequorivita lipolytica]SRX51144.1 Arylesterase [Aequorivita lipolytica]
MKLIVLLLLTLMFQEFTAFGQALRPEQMVQSYLNIKDHKIYFETSGSGQSLILIHGGYLDHDIWNNQVTYLNNNGFKTIIFDDLGHGNTRNGREELYGYEIIEQLRTHLKLGKISLVGLSWGAMLSVDYTLKYPQNVDKLVLISPGMNGWN